MANTTTTKGQAASWTDFYESKHTKITRDRSRHANSVTPAWESCQEYFSASNWSSGTLLCNCSLPWRGCNIVGCTSLVGHTNNRQVSAFCRLLTPCASLVLGTRSPTSRYGLAYRPFGVDKRVWVLSRFLSCPVVSIKNPTTQHDTRALWLVDCVLRFSWVDMLVKLLLLQDGSLSFLNRFAK